MDKFGVFSYGAAAFGWLVLLVLLSTSWRGRLQGGLLVAAVLISLLWALRAAYVANGGTADPDGWYWTLETARNVTWLIFLTHLLEPLVRETWSGRRLAWIWAAPIGCGMVLLGIEFAPPNVAARLPRDTVILGHLGLAVAGLALIEHLARNTHPQRFWATKFLYLGLGFMFAYDLFLYANALLFKGINLAIWEARGFVSAMVAPLMVVAAARNPAWSVEVFMSRRMVLYSATVIGSGIYLLAMAGIGYYLRLFGGDWGMAWQLTFLVGTVVLLAITLSSGKMRAKARVLLGKHFYQSKYDYREEWLRFTRTLSVGAPNEPLQERVIRATAEIVHSTGGLLWTRRRGGYFTLEANRNMSAPSVHQELVDTPLIRFLEQRQWVIDLNECIRDPAVHADLALPDWLRALPRAWLVVPLAQDETLNGFLVLSESLIGQRLNWEDRELLKIAGRQVASYVALLETSEALWEARQFEAFYRLSAYVVHDLKNIAAQLALVVANAGRHQTDPAFVEDAFHTVANANERMNRLLAQLRKEPVSGRVRSFALADATRQVILVRAGQLPAPVLRIEPGDEPWVRVDRERLLAVLEHLIQNAQEATHPTGRVEVSVRVEENMAVVAVRDDGCGMDEQFIREHLFRPFTTTKGNAGMGIGVYESHEFARGAGGKLTVASVPGKGTTFFLCLPRLDNPDVAKAG